MRLKTLNFIFALGLIFLAQQYSFAKNEDVASAEFVDESGPIQNSVCQQVARRFPDLVHLIDPTENGMPQSLNVEYFAECATALPKGVVAAGKDLKELAASPVHALSNWFGEEKKGDQKPEPPKTNTIKEGGQLIWCLKPNIRRHYLCMEATRQFVGLVAGGAIIKGAVTTIGAMKSLGGAMRGILLNSRPAATMNTGVSADRINLALKKPAPPVAPKVETAAVVATAEAPQIAKALADAPKVEAAAGEAAKVAKEAEASLAKRAPPGKTIPYVEPPALDASKLKNLTPLHLNSGSQNGGLMTGMLDGVPVFIKKVVHSNPLYVSIAKREAINAHHCARAGIGPCFYGMTTLPGGQRALVFQRLEGDLYHSMNTREFAAKIATYTKEELGALSRRLDEVKNYIKTHEIEAIDFQVMLTNTKQLMVIDTAHFVPGRRIDYPDLWIKMREMVDVALKK